MKAKTKLEKLNVGDEVWMDTLFGTEFHIKVKIERNEFKVQANTGEMMEEVHAYTVQEVGGQGRKWALVPQTYLHRNF